MVACTVATRGKEGSFIYKLLCICSEQRTVDPVTADSPTAYHTMLLIRWNKFSSSPIAQQATIFVLWHSFYHALHNRCLGSYINETAGSINASLYWIKLITHLSFAILNVHKFGNLNASSIDSDCLEQLSNRDTIMYNTNHPHYSMSSIRSLNNTFQWGAAES